MRPNGYVASSQGLDATWQGVRFLLSLLVCRGFASPAALRPHIQTRVRIARNTKAPREVNSGLCHTLSRIPNARFKELSTTTKQAFSRKTKSTRTLPVFMIMTVAFWLGPLGACRPLLVLRVLVSLAAAVLLFLLLLFVLGVAAPAALLLLLGFLVSPLLFSFSFFLCEEDDDELEVEDDELSFPFFFSCLFCF